MEDRPGNTLLRLLKRIINHRFNLHIGKEDEDVVTSAIKGNVDFIGANLWTLIFAIFIASIGLNVNSTAVVIGAMLISPLMGPVMGIGLGIGISDFELVKKGSRNLLVATLISIITSTVYFWVTPLHDAESELLARTTPSIWDVFIAFFGGLAGIVASTRKAKSNTNVIPGVAIATALMPPLCTAGYGLATGNMYYFLGAVYLYFINSVFICLSTFLIVRFLKFGKRRFEDKVYEKKVSRYILIITIVTVLPSIYLAYGIVNKSIFEHNAQQFVQEQFQFRNTQVVSRSFQYSANRKEIDLLLIGYELSQQAIDTIRARMSNYGLAGTTLRIRQGLNAKQEIDLSQIKASILEDVFKKDSVEKKQVSPSIPVLDKTFPDIRNELKALYPDLQHYAVTNVVLHNTDTLPDDTLTLVVTDFSKPVKTAERSKLQAWLKNRLQADSIKLVVQ